MKHVAVKWVDGIVVVRPKCSLIGWGEETDELQQVLQTLNKEQAQHVVVNLGQVKHITSPALGVLIGAHNRFAERGAKIVLSNLCDYIDNVLAVTKLSLVFKVFETEREAIEGLLAEMKEAAEAQQDTPASTETRETVPPDRNGN